MEQMRPTQRPWARPVGVAAVLCLALAGCSGESAPTSPTSPTSPSSAVPSTTVKDAQAEPASGPACLTGTWLADNDHFLASIREFGDEVKDVRGDVTVTFAADGSFTTVYDDWRIDAVAGGAKSTIHRAGTDRGTFTANDTKVSMKEVTMGSKLKVTAGGHTMAVPAAPIDYSDAAYTCSAKAASITTPDGKLKLTRR